MRAIVFLLSLIGLFGAQVSGTESRQETYEDCSDLDKVSYSSPRTVPIGERIIIKRTNGQPPKISSTSEERLEKHSPQRTTRLVFLEQPDFMKQGPWNTKVMIVGNEARPLSFTIEFIDHSSYGVSFDWLNEKLLFVRVWWGRIVSTDFVLDVETGKPIYLEEANYIRLILPCDQKREIQRETRPN